MPKSRKQKEAIVKDLVEKLQKSKALVLANYQGMMVKETQALKKKLKEQQGDFSVVKNKLFKKALEEAKLPGADFKDFTLPIAVSFSAKDEVMAAKETYTFSKTCKALEIREGYLDGKVITKEEVLSLAKLPGKEFLLAQVVGTIKAPVSGFVTVLKGNLRGLVYALKAVSDQKGKA